MGAVAKQKRWPLCLLGPLTLGFSVNSSVNVFVKKLYANVYFPNK